LVEKRWIQRGDAQGAEKAQRKAGKPNTRRGACLLFDCVYYLEHVAVGQDGSGFALHDFEITAREPGAFFRGGE
jgi:hypothetical protein